MIFARIKEIITGIFFYLVVGPFIILYGLGFILGPDIADRLPKWFGWWFMGAFGLMMVLWIIEKVRAYWAKQKCSKLNKVQDMTMIKDPDLDYEGMQARLDKKRKDI